MADSYKVTLEATDAVYDLIVLGVLKQWRDSTRKSVERHAEDLRQLSEEYDESADSGD